MNAVHRVLSPNELDPAAAGCCALAIMTKAPRAGRVKTRLSPPLTPEEAAGLNISFLRDTAAAIAYADAGAQGIGCYTPVGEEETYRDILPGNFQLIPQREGSFGERLLGAMEDLFSVGFGSVCLIDSDSPTVPAGVFAEAVKMLSQPNDRVILGPSDDGGYYLIGVKQLHRRLFEEIDWSTDRVLAQTQTRAAEENLEVHLLPAGYDVDDRATLSRLCQDLLGQGNSDFQPDWVDGLEARRFDAADTAPASREFLRGIIAREGRARIWAL
ncbi:MAG: TIGR04282 family arsenosugar biosynthesis glycosyltransferase [Chthoniobacterales bacterium]|nr:TIGR04282 family arsenosugar biosynthesis glycosyltransferase [Chthoniobacterales bacterium]